MDAEIIRSVGKETFFSFSKIIFNLFIFIHFPVHCLVNNYYPSLIYSSPVVHLLYMN